MENSIKEVNSVFEQPWWLDIVAPNSWKEIRIEEGGTRLRMAYCHQGKNTIFMPKDTQCLGVYLESQDENQNIRVDFQTQAKILGILIEKLLKYKKIDISLCCNNEYVLPFLWKDFIITPNWTYRINDLSDINAVYERFSNTAKKNIKKALKRVSITTEYKFEYLTNVLDETYKHQNRSNPENYEVLRKLTEAAIEHNSGKMFTAIDSDGNVHACSFVLFDSHVCYAWCGGSNPYFRNSGAKSLLWYECIKFASIVSPVFDFEGSMIESIENFVKQFGGVPTVYYNVQKRTIFQHVFLFYKRRIKRLIGYKQ